MDHAPLKHRIGIAFAGSDVNAVRIIRCDGDRTTSLAGRGKRGGIAVEAFHHGFPMGSAIVGSPHATIRAGDVNALTVGRDRDSGHAPAGAAEALLAARRSSLSAWARGISLV